MQEKLLQSEEASYGDKSSKMNHEEQIIKEGSSPSVVDQGETGWHYWGLIRKRSDILVLGVLSLAPMIAIVLALIPCHVLTRSNEDAANPSGERPVCFWMHLFAFLFSVLFVATFLYRSYEKFTVRKTLSTTELDDNDLPSFGYCCLHTVMELGILGTVYVQNWIMDVLFKETKKSDYQPSITDFILVYLQVWLVTTVTIVFVFRVARVALQIRNNVIPHCCDIAEVALHINCVILTIEGISRLLQYAWKYNPWISPFCLLLAWAGEYLIMRFLIRWWRWRIGFPQHSKSNTRAVDASCTATSTVGV